MDTAKALDAQVLSISNSGKFTFSVAGIVLPLVLIRGRLFVYSVKDDLTDQLDEVGSAIAMLPADAEGQRTYVPVMTESEARDRWPTIYRSLHEFCEGCLPYGDRIADALRIDESQHPEAALTVPRTHYVCPSRYGIGSSSPSSFDSHPNEGGQRWDGSQSSQWRRLTSGTFWRPLHATTGWAARTARSS